MLRDKTTFGALLLLILFAMGAGCSESEPDPAAILIGSWKIKKFEKSGEMVPPQAIAHANFNFSEDGSYQILMGELDEGTWKLSEDKKVLITFSDTNGGEQHIDLAKVTPEEVILANPQGPMPVKIYLQPDTGE